MKRLSVSIVIAVSLSLGCAGTAQAKTDLRLAKGDAYKLVVLKYLDLVNDGKRPEAIAKYAAPGFVNHREAGMPPRPAGPDTGPPPGIPRTLDAEISHVARDGDFVMVHYLVTNGPGVGQPLANPFGSPSTKVGDNVVDMFMLRKGKIVEKWDTIEAIGNLGVFK